MSTNGIVIITDTLQYIPKLFAFLKRSTEDCLQQAIGDIILIMKDPPKTLPLFSYGDSTKIAINHISYILQRSTSHPRLQLLPLPPILPQTQSENIQLKNILSIPVPAPRLELVLQPPRVQSHWSAPTPPPREQIEKACIHIQIHGLKFYKIFEDTLDSQSQENASVTPENSTPLRPFPAQL